MTSNGTVWLLDDLWTSGSSMSSAAAALKDGGADTLVGIVLGRQMNRDNNWNNNRVIAAAAAGRSWTGITCSLCR